MNETYLAEYKRGQQRVDERNRREALFSADGPIVSKIREILGDDAIQLGVEQSSSLNHFYIYFDSQMSINSEQADDIREKLKSIGIKNIKFVGRNSRLGRAGGYSNAAKDARNPMLDSEEIINRINLLQKKLEDSKKKGATEEELDAITRKISQLKRRVDLSNSGNTKLNFDDTAQLNDPTIIRIKNKINSLNNEIDAENKKPSPDKNLIDDLSSQILDLEKDLDASIQRGRSYLSTSQIVDNPSSIVFDVIECWADNTLFTQFYDDIFKYTDDKGNEHDMDSTQLQNLVNDTHNFMQDPKIKSILGEALSPREWTPNIVKSGNKFGVKAQSKYSDYDFKNITAKAVNSQNALKKAPINKDSVSFVTALGGKPITDKSGTQKYDSSGNPLFDLSDMFPDELKKKTPSGEKQALNKLKKASKSKSNKGSSQTMKSDNKQKLKKDVNESYLFESDYESDLYGIREYTTDTYGDEPETTSQLVVVFMASDGEDANQQYLDAIDLGYFEELSDNQGLKITYSEQPEEVTEENLEGSEKVYDSIQAYIDDLEQLEDWEDSFDDIKEESLTESLDTYKKDFISDLFEIEGQQLWY